MDSAPLVDVRADLPRRSAVGLKQMLLLFVIFLIVVSDAFVSGVVSSFGGAVAAGEPTNFGVVLQGVALVALYAVANHLSNHGCL